MKKIVLIIFILINIYSFGQDKNYISENKSNSTFHSVTIRDSNSINKDPLYIINGEFVNQYILSKISPNHIESINILKEEATIALYGSRGKNGIVLLKTKDSKKNKYAKLIKKYPFEISKTDNVEKITIFGKITDCENIPLPGVTISNLNTSVKYYTNFEGEYNFIANKKDVIEYSYVGYETQRIITKEKGEINIKLKALKNTNGNDKIIIAKKPVIYLYPKEKTDLIFEFEFNGKLQTTFPKYDKNWNVTAYPNGQIFDKKTNRFYNSLFWDGEIKFPSEHYNYKDGFIVTKEKLTTFLIEKLEYIGLNTNETNDFIQFWSPILEKNETNFIHFWVNKEYDVFSKNTITPKPDTSIRVFMEFYNLEKPFIINEQKLIKNERKGFTLVEWGGSDVSIPVKMIKN